MKQELSPSRIKELLHGTKYDGATWRAASIPQNEQASRLDYDSQENAARVQLLTKALREAKYWLTDGAVPNKNYGLLPDSLSAIEAIDEALKKVGMKG